MSCTRSGDEGRSVLANALAVQKEASSRGFDWTQPRDVAKKIREELDEVELALSAGTKSSLNGEVGDLFFSVINLGRVLGVDPEAALDCAVKKFERRVKDVLDSIKRSGRDVSRMTIEEIDVFWEATKRGESSETTRPL
jgi:uncharacterized protein YabN with tetrapyrrole methylase and pyrophosphatase domain